MPGNILKLKKTQGDPTVEVVIGQAHWGTYKIKLWDKNGKNPTVIGNGFSGDEINDEFKVGKITGLDDRYLSWKVRSASLDPSAGDQYHVTILIRQKGKTVPGGVFTYSGELDIVKTIGDYVRFDVS